MCEDGRCPVAVFGISDVEPSGSAASVSHLFCTAV
jgi:hypothetical protein